MSDDSSVAICLDKPTYQKKHVRKRRRAKKKNMASPWLGGASHVIPSPDSPDPMTFTSANAVEWRVLGHHANGPDLSIAFLLSSLKFFMFS